MFPTLTQQMFKTVNFCYEFTQYIFVGSWIKVGHILLYEKQ